MALSDSNLRFEPTLGAVAQRRNSPSSNGLHHYGG